jgi:hypothetical protein
MRKTRKKTNEEEEKIAKKTKTNRKIRYGKGEDRGKMMNKNRQSKKIRKQNQISSKDDVRSRVAQWYSYGLDDPGSVYGRGWQLFSSPPPLERLWGPPSLLANGHWEFFPRK